MSSIQKPQIHDAKCWPPGSMMQYKSPPATPSEIFHVGIGLVVANRHGSIAVLWDRGSNKPFCVYSLETLNEKVISRIF